MPNINIRVDHKTYDRFKQLKKLLKYSTNEGVLIKLLDAFQESDIK